MTPLRLSLLVFTLLVPATAHAQVANRFSAGVEAGIARTWNDEGVVGDGFLTGARLGLMLKEGLTLELSGLRMPHSRDFEDSPVSTDGTSFFTGLSLKYDFTRGDVRPFVVAGYGINRYSGSWTEPVLGRREFSSTDHGYNGGGGVAFNHGRLEHGPEARLYMLQIESDSSPAMIISGSYRVTLRF
ncbi:MAG: outer membrane beta-barrel protein [Acidobacteriota bacterium]|nr:outer membrane beta-barrel protein [Acidobacteriota bacterium]